MNPDQSRITRAGRSGGRELGELRDALLAFPRAAKPKNGENLDAEFVKEAAQRVVDAMRSDIRGKLGAKPNDQQERYFREVLKTMATVSGDRLKLPAYENLLEESAVGSEVALNENRASVRPFDRDSAAGGF